MIIMQCIFIDFTAFLAKSNGFEKVFLSLMKIMSFLFLDTVLVFQSSVL